jgi:ferrous iron transport protein A
VSLTSLPPTLESSHLPPETYQCPLCGYQFEFDPERTTGGCSSCPLGKGCGLVLCPNCRYEFPEESQVLNWLSRLWKGKAKKSTAPLLWPDAPGEIPLSELGVGKTGEVVSLHADRKMRAERLSAMGVTPGSHVTVKQRFPSIIITVGETEIALDRAITQDIKVKPVASDE